MIRGKFRIKALQGHIVNAYQNTQTKGTPLAEPCFHFVSALPNQTLFRHGKMNFSNT